MSDPRPFAMPIIRGERVYLRGSERSDVPLFVQWFNDAEMARHISARAPMSQVGEEAWFTQMSAQQGKDSYHFVMCRLENDQPIGTIGLFNLDLVNGNAGIGISIGDKALWGLGYGTDAMFALLDFGFGQLRLERLWLEVYDFNERAIRSYEKCGFVLEGTQRRAIYKEGRFIDVRLMSILRDEWASHDRERMWEYDPR